MLIARIPEARRPHIDVVVLDLTAGKPAPKEKIDAPAKPNKATTTKAAPKPKPIQNKKLGSS